MSIPEEILIFAAAVILGMTALKVIFWFINAFTVWSASKMLKETDPEYLEKHPELIGALFDSLPGDDKEKRKKTTLTNHTRDKP